MYIYIYIYILEGVGSANVGMANWDRTPQFIPHPAMPLVWGFVLRTGRQPSTRGWLTWLDLRHELNVFMCFCCFQYSTIGTYLDH